LGPMASKVNIPPPRRLARLNVIAITARDIVFETYFYTDLKEIRVRVRSLFVF
jgi:hypothetical protein